MKAKICDRCGAVYSDDMERTLTLECREYEYEVDICKQCFDEIYQSVNKTVEETDEITPEELEQEEQAGWFEYEKE